jgi:GT2 family glycosyltransferase
VSPRTHAVVLNWNGGEDNLVCLRSLLEQGLAPERVVFVDNASSDGSLERVRAAHPALEFVVNAKNLGYGHGSNRGIERALALGAEAVLLVNNDLAFAPGALAALEEELARDPGIGIVGPRIVYAREPARIWAAGGRMTWRANLTTLVGHRALDGPEFRGTLDVDYVPGAALLVRRAVLERVGLFEGEYFAYHEDVELCLLAREAGWRVVCAGRALALHDAHRSTGGGYNPRRKYMMGVNTVWFLRRHGTPGRWLSFLVFDVLALPLAWLVRAPLGEGAGVLAKARGTWDGLRGRRVSEEVLRGL